MSFPYHQASHQVSDKDDDESSMSEEPSYNVENCFVDSVAKEVQKNIKRESLDDEDEQWNIIVMHYFDDAFDSVSLTKVWRRFLLTLYGKELPINEQMIDNITGNKMGYKSSVLKSVLELDPHTLEWIAQSDDEEMSSTHDGNDDDDSDDNVDSLTHDDLDADTGDSDGAYEGY